MADDEAPVTAQQVLADWLYLNTTISRKSSTYVAGQLLQLVPTLLGAVRTAAQARTAQDVRVAALERLRMQAQLELAHIEGLHDSAPREGCPVCDDRQNRTGP